MDTNLWIVDENDAGERLDKWLAAQTAALSRSRIQQLIEQGELACDGAPCTSAKTKVKAGQEYTLTIPEPAPTHMVAQEIPLDIIYEDEDLLVINKAAGMTVHPGAGTPDGTLVNALLAHCGDTLSGIGGVQRPGIVHRIDKDTTGLMVVAKHDVAHRFLAAQLEDRSLSRTYQAICWGVPSPTSGTITGDIGRHPKHRQKMAVVEKNGKPATTHYKVLGAYQNLASLIECKLESGRTHQIRVHCQHLGHPLLGDSVYTKRMKISMLPASLREALDGFSRQALHAAQIRFIHPSTQQECQFEAPMPADMLGLKKTLEDL